MRDKEEKTGRGKEEKKRRKGENNWGPNGKKSPCASFSSAQSSFLSIGHTLFREKHNISTFVFMQDLFDEQIM